MGTTNSLPDCLDCIREVRKGEQRVANARQRGSSYCSHHVYQRSKASRARSGINAIIRLLKSDDVTLRVRGIEELNKEDKFLLPRIPDDLLFEYGAQYRAEAASLMERMHSTEELVEDIGKRRPYVNTVYKYLWLAFVLEQRRLPTQQEDTRLKYRDADPFFAADLERENKRKAASPDEVRLEEIAGTPYISAEDAIGRPLGQEWAHE